MNESEISDINTIAAFLANDQGIRLSAVDKLDVVVLCGSAILQCAEAVFSALQHRPDLAKVLVITGGVGHSTQYLYNAITEHPKYKAILREDESMIAESQLLYRIFERYYDGAKVQAQGLRVFIEDVSTNCGANASESISVLVQNDVKINHLLIVQDPTMSRRTLASFERVLIHENITTQIASFPTFVPTLHKTADSVSWNMKDLDTAGLWNISRYCDLVLGEIPRLRDDVNGYGPRGKGFIVHVSIPDQVLEAWERMRTTMEVKRVMSLQA